MGIGDDKFDDNRDDSCFLNHHRYNAETSSSCLVTNSAWSWQCGGSSFGSSWTWPRSPLASHRFFIGNDQESAGNTGLLEDPIFAKSVVGQAKMSSVTRRRDGSICNPLLASSARLPAGQLGGGWLHLPIYDKTNGDGLRVNGVT